MGKRIERRGLALEMWVHEKCSEMLMKLPDAESRQAVVDFLQKRVVFQLQTTAAPKPEDPRQEKLAFEPKSNGAAEEDPIPFGAGA